MNPEFESLNLGKDKINLDNKRWKDRFNKVRLVREPTQLLSDSLGLQKIVKDPTRRENIFDLAMTDLPATATTLANIGTSDHISALI